MSLPIKIQENLESWAFIAFLSKIIFLFGICYEVPRLRLTPLRFALVND